MELNRNLLHAQKDLIGYNILKYNYRFSKSRDISQEHFFLKILINWQIGDGFKKKELSNNIF